MFGRECTVVDVSKRIPLIGGFLGSEFVKCSVSIAAYSSYSR